MSDTDTALVPFEATYNTAVEMVRPLVDPRTAAAAIQQYEALKQAIQQPNDVQMYQGRPFLKKAFWRRVATCFGLSLDFISEQRGFDEAGRLFYSVFYRAVAPNGRGVTADGYCSTAERGHEQWPEHTVRATAHTRAKNRAISDIVGGGEVSAEEMPDEDMPPARPATVRPAAPAQPARKTAPPTATAPTASAAKSVTVTAAPADGDTRAKFAELRERARAAGIHNDDDWEIVCEQHAGTADPLRMLPPGKRNLVRYIAELEQQKAAAEAKLAHASDAAADDFPPADDDPNEASDLPPGARDLRELPVPTLRP